MKKPDQDGRALAESLYGSAGNTERKIAKPSDNSNDRTNLSGRPSIIPGVKYPLTQDQEELLDKAWDHFCDLKDRGLV
jgi:hypothetical protein